MGIEQFGMGAIGFRTTLLCKCDRVLLRDIGDGDELGAHALDEGIPVSLGDSAGSDEAKADWVWAEGVCGHGLSLELSD